MSDQHGSFPAEATVDDGIITVSRTTLNYVIIAIAFFVVGIAVGIAGYTNLATANRLENEDLINRAVAAALADQPAQPVQEQAGNDPDARFVVDGDDDPSIGPEDAPIVIIEFSDFKCPYCGRFAQNTLQPLLDAYEGQIRFVYRDFPILGPASVEAALASECADDQDAYWAYHDRLFENQSTLGSSTFIQIAEALELDMAQFTTCVEEKTHQAEVAADYSVAQELGVRGTPGFFINGRFVSGAMPLDFFATIIDEELASVEAAG
jgi:protein-disulfide isomerase